MVANRVDSLFAYTAKQPGKVQSITDYGIVIEYQDGSTHGLQLGMRYGRAEGAYYPHTLKTVLVVGDEFEKGDHIVYNDGFFEPDVYEPKRLVYKGNQYVTLALVESLMTNEDSCVVSARYGSQLVSKTAKVKTITVDFDQVVNKPMQIGDVVNPDSILMYINDEQANESGIFSDEIMKSLESLSANTPRAKVSGVIRRIELYYRGEKKDMTSSLKKMANDFDKQLAIEYESRGAPAANGQVDTDYRVAGDELKKNSVEIRYYIELRTNSGVGDKLVFGHQLKSVIGKVLPNPVMTKSGREVDVLFGSRSPAARVVLSTYEVGLAGMVLKVMVEKIAEMIK